MQLLGCGHMLKPVATASRQSLKVQATGVSRQRALKPPRVKLKAQRERGVAVNVCSHLLCSKNQKVKSKL